MTAHKPKVAGSSPAPATTKTPGRLEFGLTSLSKDVPLNLAARGLGKLGHDVDPPGIGMSGELDLTSSWSSDSNFVLNSEPSRNTTQASKTSPRSESGAAIIPSPRTAINGEELRISLPLSSRSSSPKTQVVPEARWSPQQIRILTCWTLAMPAAGLTTLVIQPYGCMNERRIRLRSGVPRSRG